MVVALLTESVDWNCVSIFAFAADGESLSSRRAWIEIIYDKGITFWVNGRSPHGERGLK